MAVQKSRKTPSKRGMHRSHDGLATPALSIDPQSGETHMRHRVTPGWVLSRQAGHREARRNRRAAISARSSLSP